MADVVTVTLPTGTRVTCSKETAKKLGLSEKSEPKKAPAKKAASSKTQQD